MRRWDIGSRVLVAAIVPAVLIAVALAWYFTTTRLVDLENSMAQRGAALVKRVATASEYGLLAGNPHILRQVADSVAAESAVEGVTILDSRDNVILRSGVPAEIEIVHRIRGTTVAVQPVGPESAVYIAAIGPHSSAPSERSDSRPFPTINSRETPHLLGHVTVQLSRAELHRQKRELATNAALITLTGLIIAGLLARELTRGATRPLRQLAAIVSDIERGNFSARASTESSGLVKELELGINDMATALEDLRANLERRIREATKQLENERDRAEAANRTKTQFLAAASHDLRQPLQALGLFVSSLKLRAREPDIQTLASRIERAHGALESVLDALLDITRLDAGVVSPRIEEFALAQLFANVRDTFAATATEKKLRLAIHPTNAWVKSDPGLLERIVSNLVSNALRYTDRGGVLLGARRQGNSLRIEVWDTGIGIPAERKDDIFREFVQLGEAKHSRTEGIGLGLAIVDRLCKLLGHRIALASRVRHGTVFSVTVPAAVPVARPHEPAREAVPADLSGLRVLLIDDDSDVLEALDNFFTHQGAEAMAKSSLRAAIESINIARYRPDIIISDFRLGLFEDGISAIRQLRTLLGTNVPAIVITGEAAPGILKSIEESGLTHIAKPVRPDQLRAMIHSVLRAQPAEIT